MGGRSFRRYIARYRKEGEAGLLNDILCESFERTVNKDNTVSFEERKLQIPSDKYRHHYVKAKVNIKRHIDDSLTLFHRPRKLAAFPAITTEEAKVAEQPMVMKMP